MGTVSPYKAPWALALSICLCLCNALPSVPIATDPILSTATVSTIVPSLVTIYSVVPATDSPNALKTITTTVNGRETVLTTADVVAGSSTATIISTISLTQNQVVVSTIGYSTILGPDPAPVTTDQDPTPVATTPTEVVASPTPTSSSEGAQTTSAEAPTTSEVGDVTSTRMTSTSLDASSPTSTSLEASSPTSTAAGASRASSSSSKGLSTEAKVGIAVAIVIGVILLVILSFFLGQRYSRRRNQNASNSYNNPEPALSQEKDLFTFQAGQPYEQTGAKHYSPGLSSGKGHAYSTTEVGSGSESMSGKSSDRTDSNHPSNPNDHSELSALPQLKKDDDPMYIGVPSHMSGSKRWSMKEYERR